MLELRTLGAIDLRGDDGRSMESVLRHSKRLALLAYLCAYSPPKLHRRDVLVALFWPELDELHSRGALRQELSRLRRTLGPDSLTGGSSEAVGINPERLWCDVRAFEEAMQSGRFPDALELWGGEFLPGLHVKSSEFDQWADETRDRLKRLATEAARRLSVEAEKRGAFSEAIDAARRLTELAPYDETGWRRLLLLLDRQGDRAGALKAFEAMAARLREELEVEPSPETRALMVQIRDRDRALAAAEQLLPGGRSVPRAAPAPRAIIGLEPVDNQTGDQALEWLAHRVTDRLAQGLAGLGLVDVAPAPDLARVTAVVSATLYRRGERIEVVPRLAQPSPEGRLVDMPRPVLLSPDAPGEALDQLTAHVLVSVAAHYDPRFDARAPGEAGLAIRMPLWEAYLEWIRGSELVGRLQFAEAYSHLRRACEIDPGFIKAGILAVCSLAAIGKPAEAEAMIRDMMAAGEPLGDYDRTACEWFLADLHGRRVDAYRAAVEAIAVTTSPIAFHLAGREAVHMNRPREALRRLEAVDRTAGWWRHLTEYFEIVAGAHHVLREHRAELTAVLEGRACFPGSHEIIRAEARARAALGQTDRTLALVDEALTLPGRTRDTSDEAWVPLLTCGPVDAAWVAAQELDAHGQEKAGVSVRRTALEWLHRRARLSPPEQQLHVRLLVETGDITGATRELEALAPFADLGSVALAGLVAAHAGDGARARQVLTRLEALRNPYLSGHHTLAAAGIRALLDPPREAITTLRRAFAEGLRFGVELHALPMLRPLASSPEFQALLQPRD